MAETREIANIELYCIVKELQPLIGSRLVKIYELGEDEFRFRFHKPGEGDFDVVCELKKRMNQTKFIKEAPLKPTNFTMGLRKHLTNSTLLTVMQYELDRVVTFELEKERRFLLIFEMFSHGNLILADDKFTILQAYRGEEWKDRKVKVREKYCFPASPKIEPFELNEAKLRGMLNDKKLIACLTEKIKLGPAYLEEACLRAKINLSKRADSLSEREVCDLFSALIEITECLNKPDPTLYSKDGKYFDYSLFPLKKYEGLQQSAFPTLSEALDEFYSKEGREAPKQDERILFRLSQQEKNLGEILKEAGESRAAADCIYNNYSKIETILTLIKRKLRENKIPREIMEELGKELPEEARLIEAIDRKEGKITINL